MKSILIILASTLPCLTLAANIDVYPRSLNKLPSQELGKVILKFMPSVNEKVNWYTNANDKTFVWIDPTYVEGTYRDGTPYSTRRGVFRGNVNGVVSTFLYKTLNEMPWVATMHGDNPRHGVTFVSFQPAVVMLGNEDEEGRCFGSTHENCEFSPFKSLSKVGIKYKKLCKDNLDAINFSETYLLTASGKKDTYGVWTESGGSGGIANKFLLDYESSSKEEACENNKLMNLPI